ncbi:MAG: hypothetical protein B7Y80_17670 [Hyphomicrobium sp. 32-62-53]|jgi:hypothetical protein|nr:MAG: hypothetical protein B7Z29_17135 [Hyphomicrobium sp. 12-62-95]OYX97978.1 MAG: hypothetical protein B7Y80_17670 [Hyphomicrobium sp. 32-62-53]
MEDHSEALIASYHESLERLWEAALQLHSCSGCAAQDLENKINVSALATRYERGGLCPGVCKDVRATTKPFYLVTRYSNRDGCVPGSLKDVLNVSNLVCETWDLGMRIMGCAACVTAAMVYDVRTAAAQAHVMACNREPGAVPDGCPRCCAPPVGLI